MNSNPKYGGKKEFRFLESGKPYSEIVTVIDTCSISAMKKARKGLGKKITPEELKREGWND